MARVALGGLSQDPCSSSEMLSILPAAPMEPNSSASAEICCPWYVRSLRDPNLVSHSFLQLYNYTQSSTPAIDPEAFLSATVSELIDMDITEGRDRVERYLEVLQSAAGLEYYQTVLAKTIERLTSSDAPLSPDMNLQNVLEWLSTVRVSESLPQGVPLAAHEEKITCIKAYFLVSLMTSATPQQLQESPRDRRQAAIHKIFDESRMANGNNGLTKPARQYADCSLEDYKAVVIAVHDAL